MLLLKNYINLYTHHSQSSQIVKIMKKYIDSNTVLVDATAGMGGDSVFFCKNFKFIYCLEKNYSCINYLEHNLEEFKNKEIFNINCIEGLKILKYDSIYFDPPWGGKNYKLKSNLDLFLNNNNITINILDLIDSLYFYTKFIFIKVPLNFNISKLNNMLWKHTSFPIFKYTNDNTNDNTKTIFNLIVFTK